MPCAERLESGRSLKPHPLQNPSITSSRFMENGRPFCSLPFFFFPFALSSHTQMCRCKWVHPLILFVCMHAHDMSFCLPKLMLWWLLGTCCFKWNISLSLGRLKKILVPYVYLVFISPPHTPTPFCSLCLTACSRTNVGGYWSLHLKQFPSLLRSLPLHCT